MKISPQQYAAALTESITGLTPRKSQSVMAKFGQIIKKHGDQSLSKQIMAEFTEIIDQQNKSGEIKIITQVPLGGLDELSQKLSLQTGREYRLINSLQDDLIGGAIMVIDNLKIDLSIKSRLHKAKQLKPARTHILPEYIEEIIKIIQKNIA
ncbi:MAG: F0F1 ATP synthase subunit delta [Patescibacteria group bacterium]